MIKNPADVLSFHFAVDLRVSDLEALIEHAAEVNDADVAESADVFRSIAVGVVNPIKDPRKCGFEIVSTNVEEMDDFYRLSLECKVKNATRVAAEARKCYAENWGDESWSPASTEEALYEILVASNANPSPSDIGFVILDPPHLTPNCLEAIVNDLLAQGYEDSGFQPSCVENRTYIGKVVANGALHVAQDLGRKMVAIHELRNLDKSVLVGENLTVRFEGGRGLVTSAVSASKELGR